MGATHLEEGEMYVRLKELQRQLEILEIREEYIKDETKNLKREMIRAKEEIRRVQSVPLVIGQFSELIDAHHAVVSSTAGSNYYVRVLSTLSREELKPSCSVALHRGSHAVVDILPPEADSTVQSAAMTEKPDVTYADIGGMDVQKQEMREAVELPLTHGELYKQIGIDPPSGVLLYGPPGTGKTMLAKAVANQTTATFIRMVGSEFVQKYLGEGPRMVRDVFRLARENAPSIVFIDEIDSIATKRFDAQTGADREVQRILIELLNQMDGFDQDTSVKVIMATNRADTLDPALLRPGRLDRKIEFPLPDKRQRALIFQTVTAKMNLADDVDIRDFVGRPDKISAADIAAICQEAGMQAVRRNRYVITLKDFEKGWKEHVKRKDVDHEFYAIMSLLLLISCVSGQHVISSFITNLPTTSVLRPSMYSLISPATTTVVTLFKDSVSADTDGGITLQIRDQGFTCNAAPTDRTSLVRAYKARAQLAPLAGLCFSDASDSVQLCPDKEDVLLLECKGVAWPQFATGVVCRIGDAVQKSLVITQTFLDRTVRVKDTRTGKEHTTGLANLGCHSDGHIASSNFFTVINQHVVESPLCSSSRFDSLAPLTNSCFIGTLHNRQIEFCYPNVVRVLQHRDRVGHRWPDAVRLTGSPATPLRETRGKQIIFEPITFPKSSCAALQPSLSEQYIVRVDGTELEAVGGSFMPLQFADSAGVAGILVFDSDNPMGCSEKSFPNHLLPRGAPWIALVERNGCMFHDKGLIAQKRGAVGVVVINTFKRGMIPALAGIPTKPVLDIPLVLVDMPGLILKEKTELVATIGPRDSVAQKAVTASVAWYCDANWETERSCLIGDTVGVRREGESADILGRIEHVFSSGFFTVNGELLPGWQLFRDAATPCTSQFGTRIMDVSVTGMCQLNLKIHSSLLCADAQFREPPKLRTDIHCNRT